jgi:hypothetical protein
MPTAPAGMGVAETSEEATDSPALFTAVTM